MTFDLDELKKNHNTSYLASVLERLAREETEVREMLDSDESLHEMAGKELQFIQEERERTEKQVQDILDKDKEAEEFPNEIVLEVRAGAGGGGARDCGAQADVAQGTAGADLTHARGPAAVEAACLAAVAGRARRARRNGLAGGPGGSARGPAASFRRIAASADFGRFFGSQKSHSIERDGTPS